MSGVLSHRTFLPGLEAGERLYWETIRPVLDAEFPGLPHSAGLLGDGSEVLGFDTPMSTDHDWGPRALLFVEEDDHVLGEALRRRLTPSQVTVWTIRGFFLDALDFDIRDDIAPADWLTFGEQKLLAVTAGAVFEDGIGLQAVRDRFAYYPRDVWLYLLAAGWERIGQEEHLMGRAGSVGDEIGSAIIGARLARDLMRLGFLMEKQYAPYPKWLGAAFARLACAGELLPLLGGALSAQTWPERERHLCAAYERVAAGHNALGITEPLSTEAFPFFSRPFRVIGGGRFAQAIRARIDDPAVRRIAGRRLIGGVDQFSDSTDLLAHPRSWRQTLRRLYE